MEPVLDDLAEAFGETAHYAVLDGDEVVYRAKRDPSEGAIRLTSTVGGRNPAVRTGVGKMLLAWRFPDAASAAAWADGQELLARTPTSITDPHALADALVRARADGFSVDDQENEPGVNCVALPVFLDSPTVPSGAISVSALAFRTPLADLVRAVDRIRAIADAHGVRTTQATISD